MSEQKVYESLDRSIYTPHERARVKAEIRRRCNRDPVLVEIMTVIDLNDLGDPTLQDFISMLRTSKHVKKSGNNL